jgi:group I intron endonuclease
MQPKVITIGVYKITSPTGKVYIGSSRNIERRFYLYKLLRCSAQIKLYHSFVKHGVENHLFEIVCECHPDELLQLEAYYGALHNVLDNASGLNLRLPYLDEKLRTVNEETRRKLSEGAYRSYDIRGRKSDDPAYLAEKAKKKKEKDKRWYNKHRKQLQEVQFNNRSVASANGWNNPDRKVKRLSKEEKKQKKYEYQIAYRARTKVSK